MPRPIDERLRIWNPCWPFLLLWLPPVLIAQTPSPFITFFVPTDENIAGFRRIGVTICNQSDQTQRQTGAQFMRDAAEARISVATYTELRSAAKRMESTSWQRKALLAVEIAGWLTTAVIASDLVKIRERYKAVVPLFTGGLRFSTTMIRPPAIEIPPLRPPIVQLAAGECAEFSVFGTVN